jgi:hypothetical protein
MQLLTKRGADNTDACLDCICKHPQQKAPHESWDALLLPSALCHPACKATAQLLSACMSCQEHMLCINTCHRQKKSWDANSIDHLPVHIYVGSNSPFCRARQQIGCEDCLGDSV